MKKKLFVSAVYFFLLVIAGRAQTAMPKVTERQENQQARIAQVVKSGESTPVETKHLQTRETKIQDDKKEAKSDGRVTPAERAKLNREEHRSSQAIYLQKHNEQVRK
jgi:hypothetical protein